MIFDGHDELNEFTHEGNEKLLEHTLNRINALATGKEEVEE
jgi:hypothetical protein